MRPPEGPRKAPGWAPGGPPEALKKTYSEYTGVRQYTKNVRLTRSFCPLVDVVPAALECHESGKQTLIK